MMMVRIEITSLRSGRDKLALESNFAREKLDSFMKEFEHQVIIHQALEVHLWTKSMAVFRV